MTSATVVCARCAKSGLHVGRGLCSSCYHQLHHKGEHIDYPRTFLAVEEYADDVRTRGLRSVAEDAAYYGVTRSGIQRRRARARKLGLLP